MLYSQFLESATEICDILKNQGFWADFIDPTSGNAVSHIILSSGYQRYSYVKHAKNSSWY